MYDNSVNNISVLLNFVRFVGRSILQSPNADYQERPIQNRGLSSQISFFRYRDYRNSYSRLLTMSGLSALKKTVFKNDGLLRQIRRPLHVSSARATKSVAPRQSLNSDYVLDIHYDFHYRDQIKFDAWDKKKNTIADICMGTALAYVLYKCYSEPEHLLGEFEYPDASKWTDEELGVPPIE